MGIDINCDECSCGLEASEDIICRPCWDSLKLDMKVQIKKLEDEIIALTKERAGV